MFSRKTLKAIWEHEINLFGRYRKHCESQDCDLESLLDKAISSLEKRKDENIKKWAEKLAKDLVDAGEKEYEGS